MCGALTNAANPKAAGLFGPPASGFSGRYGFGSTAAPSSVSEQERQWYIDNKFGDPYEVDKQSKMIHPWMPPATSSNYKGVSNEARYLYQQSSAPSKTVYLQERAPSSAASALGVPANTRFAGKSLTINPVAA
jgi:hypothetical protein